MKKTKQMQDDGRHRSLGRSVDMRLKLSTAHKTEMIGNN
jgi:hypothetical protein